MKTQWNEIAIRNEIKRLYAITGLNGNSLPIKYSKSKRTMGQFTIINQKAGYFTFSNYYLQDPDFPDEEILDLIRHEYAHYHDYTQNSQMGHGQTWKECCRIVGACPQRYLIKARVEALRAKHQSDKERLQKYIELTCGTLVEHSRYSLGEIINVEGTGLNLHLEIDFINCGIKRLGASWVSDNCTVSTTSNRHKDSSSAQGDSFFMDNPDTLHQSCYVLHSRKKGSIPMKKITNIEAMNINGGKTYKCIGCSKKSSNFCNIYSHCLTSGHFKKNKYLKACWETGWDCLTMGLKRLIK